MRRVTRTDLPSFDDSYKIPQEIQIGSKDRLSGHRVFKNREQDNLFIKIGREIRALFSMKAKDHTKIGQKMTSNVVKSDQSNVKKLIAFFKRHIESSKKDNELSTQSKFKNMGDLQTAIMKLTDEVLSAKDLNDHIKLSEWLSELKELKRELETSEIRFRPPPTQIKQLKNQFEEIEIRVGIREPKDHLEETLKMFEKAMDKGIKKDGLDSKRDDKLSIPVNPSEPSEEIQRWESDFKNMDDLKTAVMLLNSAVINDDKFLSNDEALGAQVDEKKVLNPAQYKDFLEAQRQRNKWIEELKELTKEIDLGEIRFKPPQNQIQKLRNQLKEVEIRLGILKPKDRDRLEEARKKEQRLNQAFKELGLEKGKSVFEKPLTIEGIRNFAIELLYMDDIEIIDKKWELLLKLDECENKLKNEKSNTKNNLNDVNVAAMNLQNAIDRFNLVMRAPELPENLRGPFF